MMENHSILDRIGWPHRLSDSQYTIGGHSVRRYAKGFPPIAAFCECGHPDWQTSA